MSLRIWKRDFLASALAGLALLLSIPAAQAGSEANKAAYQAMFSAWRDGSNLAVGSRFNDFLHGDPFTVEELAAQIEAYLADGGSPGTLAAVYSLTELEKNGQTHLRGFQKILDQAEAKLKDPAQSRLQLIQAFGQSNFVNALVLKRVMRWYASGDLALRRAVLESIVVYGSSSPYDQVFKATKVHPREFLEQLIADVVGDASTAEKATRTLYRLRFKPGRDQWLADRALEILKNQGSSLPMHTRVALLTAWGRATAPVEVMPDVVVEAIKSPSEDFQTYVFPEIAPAIGDKVELERRLINYWNESARTDLQQTVTLRAIINHVPNPSRAFIESAKANVRMDGQQPGTHEQFVEILYLELERSNLKSDSPLLKEFLQVAFESGSDFAYAGALRAMSIPEVKDPGIIGQMLVRTLEPSMDPQYLKEAGYHIEYALKRFGFKLSKSFKEKRQLPLFDPAQYGYNRLALHDLIAKVENAKLKQQLSALEPMLQLAETGSPATRENSSANDCRAGAFGQIGSD